MCGRYRIKDPERLKQFLREAYGIDWDENPSPRYNIAPSLEVPVIVMDDEGDVLPIPSTMKWGFAPYWQAAENRKIEPNARAESVVEKPTFREAVQRRRLLVPADGFYEWERRSDREKYPFDIHLQGDRPFLMAGIYEQATQLRPASFALLTTRPNELMAKIHDRMPVILEGEQARRWLRRGPITAEEMARLSAPRRADDMAAVPISTLVNNAANDLPEVLEPVSPPPPKQVQDELF